MRTLDDAVRDCIALVFELEKKAALLDAGAPKLGELDCQYAIGGYDAYSAVAARLREIFNGVEGIDLEILRAHRSLLRQVSAGASSGVGVSLYDERGDTRMVTLPGGAWILPNGEQMVVPPGETREIEVYCGPSKGAAHGR